jgi:hypothetical protein
MKNYIGISRDHSGSMRVIARPAARDYNDNIAVIAENADRFDIDTVVSVVECGAGRTSHVKRVVVNSNVSALKPIPEKDYVADGTGTPLFDSVGELIELLESVPDASDPDVSFLVMAVTDGHENASIRWNARRLAAKIRELQATDRWTFIFRVPKGHARQLAQQFGVHEGNILEWDQTQRGVEQAQQRTREAFTQYYTERSTGVRSTTRFYADLTAVAPAAVEASLDDISSEVSLWPVTNSDQLELRTFVEKRTKPLPLLKGAAFYQLSKTEDVQARKLLAIRDKVTHKVYAGPAARQLLGLPTTHEVRLSPGNTGHYDVFVQSTSVNRKLVAGTNVLYWTKAGTAYGEGPSAR